MEVVTVYLWLDGCAPEWLAEEPLERVLLAAVQAGGFELLYHHVSTHDGKVVALAVVGESHVVLHGDIGARTLCAEVLSCTTRAAAQAAIDVARAQVPHDHATEQWMRYQVESGFEPEG